MRPSLDTKTEIPVNISAANITITPIDRVFAE